MAKKCPQCGKEMTQTTQSREIEGPPAQDGSFGETAAEYGVTPHGRTLGTDSVQVSKCSGCGHQQEG